MVRGIKRETTGMLATLYSRSVEGFVKRVDTSNFIECLECFQSDEHMVVGMDDGALVPPIACEFSRLGYGNILAVVDESGGTTIQDTNKTGHFAVVSEWQAHSNAIFDLAWVPMEEKLVTASGDQTAVLWDVPRSEKIDVFKGHTSSVRTIAFRNEDSAVFATGSRDGHVMIWDKRCNRKEGYVKPVNTIRNAHAVQSSSARKPKNRQKLGPARDSQQSVTVVVFQEDTTLLSAGAVDGCVKFWDLRKTYSSGTTTPESKHTISYSGSSLRKHGFTCLTMDSCRSMMFASCTDDIVYQYDITSTPRLVHQYKGHRNNSFYVKTSISPDDQFILSGSSDEVAYIWQVDKPNQSPVVLKGHKAEVSDVAWSPTDLGKVVTLSDDNTVKVWRMNRRLSPPEQGEVNGTAERTHREIGTSAGQPNIKETKDPESTISASQPVAGATPKMPKLKKTMSEGNSPNVVSPSIKHWLSGKTFSVNKSESRSDEMDSPAEVGKKRPCKRKLVSDSPEQSPRKRQNVLQDITSNTDIGSPLKSASPTITPFKNEYGMCSKSPVKSSPKKWNSPRKLNLKCVSRQLAELQPQSTLSPTAALPNLVLSGEVSRINVCYKQDKENSPRKGATPIDWLNKIRLQKMRGVDTNQGSKLSPSRALFCRSAECSPSRSMENSQSSSSEGSSVPNSQSEEKSKTPVRGMKSLHHYFLPRENPKVDPVG